VPLKYNVENPSRKSLAKQTSRIFLAGEVGTLYGIFAEETRKKVPKTARFCSSIFMPWFT